MMDGITVRREIVNALVAICKGADCVKNFVEGGGVLQVTEWDGEAELVRPWLVCRVPVFRALGMDDGAWEIEISLEIAVGKAVGEGAFLDGLLGGCLAAVREGLADVLAERRIWLSEIAPVESDPDPGVDKAGRFAEGRLKSFAAVDL